MTILYMKEKNGIEVGLTQLEQSMLMDRVPHSPKENHEFAEHLYVAIELFKYDHSNADVRCIIID